MYICVCVDFFLEMYHKMLKLLLGPPLGKGRDDPFKGRVGREAGLCLRALTFSSFLPILPVKLLTNITPGLSIRKFRDQPHCIPQSILSVGAFGFSKWKRTVLVIVRCRYSVSEIQPL